MRICSTTRRAERNCWHGRRWAASAGPKNSLELLSISRPMPLPSLPERHWSSTEAFWPAASTNSLGGRNTRRLTMMERREENHLDSGGQSGVHTTQGARGFRTGGTRGSDAATGQESCSILNHGINGGGSWHLPVPAGGD